MSKFLLSLMVVGGIALFSSCDKHTLCPAYAEIKYEVSDENVEMCAVTIEDNSNN